MNEHEKTTFSIKTWAEEDRPREKLQFKGKHSLSNSELLAIIIGSGNSDESAVGLSQRILSSVADNLNTLGKKSIKDLMQFKGIGEAKAISIIAAVELGRRRQMTAAQSRLRITSSQSAFDAIAPTLIDLLHEEFWILLLNQSNLVIARSQVSIGGVTGTIVDPRVVFKKAIEENAVSIILCHNHPSGSLRPSQADLDITKKLKKAGETLDIKVLDHLIVSENGYFSFADEGVF